MHADPLGCGTQILNAKGILKSADYYFIKNIEENTDSKQGAHRC